MSKRRTKRTRRAIIRPSPALPSEIVHAILNESRRLAEERQQYAGDKTKHGYAVLASTCRYWQEITRPVLFQSLELRSVDDVYDLQKLLLAPNSVGPPLSKCIQALTIQQRGSQATGPWLHHLYRVTQHLPDTTVRLVMGNFYLGQGHHPDQHRVPATWYLPSLYLPRTVPHMTTFPSIKSLTMNHLQFPQAIHLVRFIHNLPGLEHIACVNPEFLHGIDSTFSLPHWRWEESLSGSTLLSMSLDDCRFNVQLRLAAALLSVGPRLRFDDESWLMTMRAIISLVPTKCQLIDLEVHERGCLMEAQSDDTHLRILLNLQPHEDSKAGPGHSILESCEIQILGLSGQPPGQLGWNIFETELWKCAHVPDIVLDVYTRTSDFRWLLEAILERKILVESNDAEKLHLRYGGPGKPAKMEQVLSLPEAQVVGRDIVHLTPGQRFELFQCVNVQQRETYLQELRASSNLGGRDAVQEMVYRVRTAGAVSLFPFPRPASQPIFEGTEYVHYE